MKTLYFGNNGIFDVRAMLTFGVSAKEGENAIGYFGTGFKYAVAIILRLGGKIRIHTNGTNYEFTKATETIRNQDFEVVKVNGQDAGFTTRLGINWQPWMAFREIWCNCKDEGGEVSTDMPDFDTVIAVECDEIYNAYLTREKFILSGTPLINGDECDIYTKPSEYVFYRGIAVYALRDNSILTYNIKASFELTEDRTAKHAFMADHYIRRELQKIEEPELMRRVLTADKDTYEGTIRYDADYKVSDCFINTALQLLKTGVGVRETIRIVLERHHSSKGAWPEAKLTRVQQQMLDKAVSFLAKLDMPVTQFPIKIVNGLGDGIMGQAVNGTIYISPLPFNMGTKQVASTLMEEWVHCKHGVQDFDRAMQNWLFDKILSLGEEINGQPV